MNEIKAGDIVRVSKDAQKGSAYSLNPLWFTEESTVVELMGFDHALITLDVNNHLAAKLDISIKHLTKVNAEPKFIKGDKVRINCAYEDGEVWDKIIHGRIATVKSSYRNAENIIMYKFEEGIRDFAEHWLEPYTEPKEPTIKVGDKVRVISAYNPQTRALLNSVGEVIDMNDSSGCYVLFHHTQAWICKTSLELIAQPEQPTEKSNFGRIAIPVEADLADTFWDAYAADLAKEIAVKLSDPSKNIPSEVADYALRVTKLIVNDLKESEE